MGKTQYPQGRMLLIRDCVKAICMDNSAATKLLSTLMYWYDHSNSDAVNGVFTVRRTQSDLIKDMCEETNVTTLHAVAIPFLQLLGYLDIEGQDGTLKYLIHVDRVHNALAAYSKKLLPDFLRASIEPQLQNFGIELTQDELKNLVINSKILEKQLQKIVIANKKNCNCKRGRKPRIEATSVAKTPTTENKENKEITKESKEANASSRPLIKNPLPFPKEEKPPKLQPTNGHKPIKPKSDLEKLTEQEQGFWFMWLNVDQNKKVKPALKPAASEHIQALAPHVTTQEQIDSLTTFARQKTRQELKQPELWHIELGNLRRHFAEWDRQFSGATSETGATITKPERSHNLVPELQAAKNRLRMFRIAAAKKREKGDITGAEHSEQCAAEELAEIERLSQQEQQIA